ncbi:MAG: dihydropteroate synthase [Deltaproteobacteria bacterium]|nr:dihydropteroate synthase [Deltaproteobacteria bacterium]
MAVHKLKEVTSSQIRKKGNETICPLKRENVDLDYGGGILPLGDRTHIMGILNVTPDSFSDGGNYLDPFKAIDQAARMIDDGAHIIDMGGESTRPGAAPVSGEEELKRILPVIKVLAKSVSVPISVDTYKAEVARRVIDAGAHIINDISGLRFDPHMARVAAEANCPVIVMHIKGKPGNMQINPQYDSLMDEVKGYLEESIFLAEEAGIASEKIIIDPGIGFGKRFEDNLQLINRLGEFNVLGKAILIGPSRKSFVGQILDAPPEERVEGTIAASILAIEKGAHIIRVHDVREAAKAVKVADAILKSN